MLWGDDRQQMVDDVAGMIRLTGQGAEIRRRVSSSFGSFAGPDEPVDSLVGIVDVEFQSLLPEELKQIGADGICSVLPGVDIQEGDILVFQNVRYVVTDVRPENCFGAVTHLTVRLEREYRRQ